MSAGARGEEPRRLLGVVRLDGDQDEVGDPRVARVLAHADRVRALAAVGQADAQAVRAQRGTVRRARPA